ncbi:MAG: cupin domain-containing protein [Casimicrobiaceae bacterium]
MIFYKSMIYNNPDRPDEMPEPLTAELTNAVVLLPAGGAPTERIRTRLLARIHAERDQLAASATQAMANAFITLRKSTEVGDGWVELLPKAHAKLLFTDGEAESYMIRLEPGAWAPAHEHPADEECLVLEGTLWQGDVFLQAGDFHVARPGMKHGELRTDTGALVFIRYAKPLGQYIQL